jgi:hypothetical protein
LDGRLNTVSQMKRDIPFQSILYQDAGFQGFRLLGVQIMQPKKKPRNGTLTPQEKEENRRISSIRVRIQNRATNTATEMNFGLHSTGSEVLARHGG